MAVNLEFVLFVWKWFLASPGSQDPALETLFCPLMPAQTQVTLDPDHLRFSRHRLNDSLLLQGRRRTRQTASREDCLRQRFPGTDSVPGSSSRLLGPMSRLLSLFSALLMTPCSSANISPSDDPVLVFLQGFGKNVIALGFAGKDKVELTTLAPAAMSFSRIAA